MSVPLPSITPGRAPRGRDAGELHYLVPARRHARLPCSKEHEPGSRRSARHSSSPTPNERLARLTRAPASAAAQPRRSARHTESSVELGTPAWQERTDDELRRAYPRPRRDRGLTAAEEQVAALVASGRTNREVASQLFTTVKTVESHLTRIYRKIGVRSRTELARHYVDADNTDVHG